MKLNVLAAEAEEAADRCAYCAEKSDTSGRVDDSSRTDYTSGTCTAAIRVRGSAWTRVVLIRWKPEQIENLRANTGHR